MSWETIKKNMEEHNGKFRPEQSTAGKSVSKKERQNNKNFWNNTRDILVNTLKDTTIDQTKSFIKTGDFDRKDVWNRVQNIANNNLNRFNNTQKNIDVNTRNQMARNMEDFANRKRTAMQSVSNVIQENSNNKRKPLSTIRNSSNEGEDINIVSKKGREKLTSSIKKQIGENILELSNSIGHYDNGNRIKIYRDDSGQIDKNRTDLEIAQKSFEEDKRKLQMIENKKIFEKAMNEQLKNTLNYKVAKRQNPNATDEELLKIAKEKEIKSSQEFIEWLADMDPGRRNAMIEDFTYNKNQKYDLKSRVQAIETQREADKINQDAQNGNYWSSIGHVAKGLPEGAINSVAKTAATLESLSNGKHYNTLVNPNYDSVLETKLRTRKYQETTSKIDNGIVQTASGVSNTIGEMAPSMLVNVAAPGYGAVLNAVNVGSSGYLDTLNEDSSNKLQAVATGLPKALASYGIEKIIGGNFLSEGSLDDWAAEVIAKKTAGITNKTANKVAQKVASKIYEVGGEVFEEELENQVDYLIDATINDKGISLREWLDEQEETVKNTALTQLTLGLFGLGGDTYKKVKEYEANADTKTWINEAQKIIDKENLEINTDEIKKRELRNVVNKVDIKEDNEVNNKSSDLQQNTTDNSIKPLTQQTTSQENKVAQNGNVEQMQTSNYNNSDYFQTAKNYNLDTNNETIRGIYDVTFKRGVNVFWDDTVFTNSKQNAKWTIDSEGNRSVVLNPNADTDVALQSVMIHELIHDIEGTKEYSKINSMILDKLKSSSNYDDMMTDIAKAYENEYKNMSKEQFKSMIEQEAVADYLGENLGNQEFVNELVRSTDRTQIQKIMDWIKNKITTLKNTITGNKELNYWNKIKENFERAYNKEYQGNSVSERFSIQIDNEGKQYVKVDTDQNIFEGIDKKDYNKIAKMYMQDYLKGNTILAGNDNANIGRRGVNKYTNPQQNTRFFEEKMQLTPELQNVLEIAEKVSTGNPTKETTKFPNWEYYKFNFELGGENFEGLINIGIDKEGNKHFYEINKIHNTRNIECFIETKKYYG